MNSSQTAFSTDFLPSKASIHAVIKKFQEKDSILNRNNGNSGRRATVITLEKVHLVQATIENKSRIPARRKTFQDYRDNRFRSIEKMENGSF